MAVWSFIVLFGVIAAVAVAVLIGRRRETANAQRLAGALVHSGARPSGERVDFESFRTLPPPVARYFRNVLLDGQGVITAAEIRQSGVLRTGISAGKWLSFTANELAVPAAHGFVWDARVVLAPGLHVRVLDSYIDGAGTGRVSVLSAFPIDSESGKPELGSGALHRYLAEAPWFPTALLPQSGVVWSPIDENTALATLTDRGTTVSLEFRFNSAGEVIAVYSPGRFGRFDAGYRQMPWEGRFGNYQVRAGMRIPLHGEAGWFDGGKLGLVWKGDIVDISYSVAP